MKIEMSRKELSSIRKYSFPLFLFLVERIWYAEHEGKKYCFASSGEVNAKLKFLSFPPVEISTDRWVDKGRGIRYCKYDNIRPYNPFPFRPDVYIYEKE